MIGVFFGNRSRHGNIMTPLRVFFKKSLKGGCTCHNFLNYGKTLNKLYESVLEIF